ncbi:hypothetical protein HOLleu_18300 [Holothuria leucospilota]|uniref:Uncharacterized protein n=1 Tax=Holothuria leucospilota TaxID=206669 RepID=A0A9Q1C324_HOLLE|nr:hypothetical protein HOLleu_18300 [Holothuria leucospilota]
MPHIERKNPIIFGGDQRSPGVTGGQTLKTLLTQYLEVKRKAESSGATKKGGMRAFSTVMAFPPLSPSPPQYKLPGSPMLVCTSLGGVAMSHLQVAKISALNNKNFFVCNKLKDLPKIVTFCI